MISFGLGQGIRRGLGLAIAVVLFAACSTSVVPTGSISGPTAASSPAPATTSPTTAASPGGFAFAADDVVAYYAGLGYTCTAPQPSTKAAGYSFRSCSLVDSAGRTRVVGVVVDASGSLADAFASVRGTSTEAFLAPTDALDPSAAFLGAMLGQDAGAGLLTWLAGHLGDTMADTTVGDLRVATYTASDTDHATLYVEIASQAYVTAPRP